MKKRALNGMRFYIALTIVICHMYFLDDAPEKVSYFYNTVLKSGGFGVTFFFLLSGFVIGLNYRKSFLKLTKENYLMFIKKRILSFYGVYIFSVLVTALIEVIFYGLTKIEALKQIIVCACMLQSVSFTYHNVLNDPMWYMSCLFFFYLITPVILYVFQKIKDKACVIAIIVSYVILVGLIGGYILIIRAEIFNFHNVFILFYGTPFGRFINYLIGIFLSFFVLDYIKNIKIDKMKATIFEVIAIILCGLAYGYGLLLERYIISNFIYIPVLVLLILVLSLESGWISGFLMRPINLHLGKITGVLYICHYIIINFGGSMLLLKILNIKSSLGYVFCAILLVLISIGISEVIVYVEMKINKLIKINNKVK